MTQETPNNQRRFEEAEAAYQVGSNLIVRGAAVLATLFLIVPIVSIVVEVPWPALPELVGTEVVRDATAISIGTSALAASLAMLLGFPLAWVLARHDFRGRSLLRVCVTLPLVLPPVVGGMALLYAFGRQGVVGRIFSDSVVLPFSFWGVVVANTFVALPFFVLTVEAALLNSDRRYESVAASLGAHPRVIVRRIVLPLVRPAVVTGLVLSWARALGEFGATITFAGNRPGVTQNLPIAVFIARESDRSAALALSLILIVISMVVLFALRKSFTSGLSWTQR